MSAIRMTVTGVGDARRRLAKATTLAKADEGIGEALDDGATAFRDTFRRAYAARNTSGRRGRGMVPIERAVRKGKTRPTDKGPGRFAGIDRKVAASARFLETGTRRQKARPVFREAVARARTPARRAVKSGLERLVRKFLTL